MNNIKYIAFLPFLAVSCLTMGCNGFDAKGTSATMSLSVADTPVDSATKVVVAFTGVQLHGGLEGDKTFNFASPKQIDLMTTRNGNAALLLNGMVVPAGDYQWIRLMVDPSQSTITLSDGTEHVLTIPSGSQNGLKLVSGFSMAAGDQVDFTVDFALRKAVTQTGGQYVLKPALRLINNQQVGAAAGSVDNTFVIGSTPITATACSPAVYVYSGADATLVDISASSTDQPLTTTTLKLNSTTGNYDYKAAFLSPGGYTLAVTCAGSDDATAVDNLAFSAPKNITVAANTTASVNFP